MSWLPSVFSSGSLALCTLGRRSALDGVRREPAAGCAPLFLSQPGMYAADFRGAPNAQQVADRWHLLANLSEALKPFFSCKQAQLKALVEEPPETFSEEEETQLPAWYTGQTNSKVKMYDAHYQERVERYHKVPAPPPHHPWTR